MKTKLIAFLHKPLLVTIVSLVIAGGILYVVLQDTQHIGVSVPQFVQATSGSISLNKDVSPKSVQHLSLGFLAGGRIKDITVQVGDEVKKDMILATLDQENTQGAIIQAEATLATAQANYQKVLNGATGPTIDVARTALENAKINLSEVTQQQSVLVKNAYTALLNVSPQAYPEDIGSAQEEEAPKITGSYTLGKEGDIIVKTYASNAPSGLSYRTTGLVEGTESAFIITQQPLGNSGLYIQFPEGARVNRTWIISLPNKKATEYVTRESAYQSALQTQQQTIATAQLAVNQAEANLASVVSSARPEDVAAAQAQVMSAQGALQIAQSAFNNRRILAPSDGKITAIRISPGEIATPNIPAIELSTNMSLKDVAVMVPNRAIYDREGKYYVQLKTASGDIEEREITIGISDLDNTEVITGLSIGDEVRI